MTNKDKQLASTSNFLRTIIESDIAAGTFASRTWGGQPGPASTHQGASPDPWKIRTRFPPEPNGYLHIGHAKSICLNFGLALDYNGVCHLRFDDTNPVTENVEYVDAIIDNVKWLGFDWHEHLYFASDYFDEMYRFAELFIERGLAYVDSLTPDQIREYRGTLTEPGKDSPDRDRPPADNLKLFHEMRDGLHPDGSLSLRLKIDMSSPNINMRDPVIYRIRHALHHRSGDKWCVYPMYDYSHCISDALENITHSICTLEFEDHRILYDWILEKLADFGVLNRPLPHQYEFSRLNLTYVVLSKRRLIQLVTEKHVSGWDDPRMPTLVGARRRGYPAEGFRLFSERIGVSKADSWIDYSVLEDCMREVLNESAPRRIAVLEPLKLIIDNYPAGQKETCVVSNHPQKPDWGTRNIPFSGELWIERSDFTENPPKGYFRLFPGNTVRLRYGYVVKCTSCEKDANGNVTAVHCEYFPDSKSGTPGANNYKVKGNIHWLCATNAARTQVHLYDRLFRTEHPGREHDFLEDLNPDSKTTIDCYVEPLLGEAVASQQFQFERHGYFMVDPVESTDAVPVFNRTVTLRDSWAKQKK